MDVSIIVPLYRGKKYIRHIIEMVRTNQKTLMENGRIKDIEIIFVNDCPSEKIEILEFQYINDISIQVYENRENLGIYKSRLRGLEKSKGLYILFLDQDDEISPFYLWRQYNFIGKADAVLCNGVYRTNRIIYKDLKQQKDAVSKDEFIGKGNIIISPGQVLLKKSSIPSRWLNLMLGENGSDDVLLWTLMLCEGRTFNINPAKDYIHNESGHNVSLDFRKMKKSVYEMLKVAKEQELLDDRDLNIFEKACLERIYKYNSYINILDHWKEILITLNGLLKIDNSKKFAIYGNGIIGKKLLGDLDKFNLTPEFVIDRAAENFTEYSYKVYSIDNIPQNVDLIILTPLFDIEKIVQDLNGIKARIIRLDELIENRI